MRYPAGASRRQPEQGHHHPPSHRPEPKRKNCPRTQAPASPRSSTTTPSPPASGARLPATRRPDISLAPAWRQSILRVALPPGRSEGSNPQPDEAPALWAVLIRHRPKHRAAKVVPSRCGSRHRIPSVPSIPTYDPSPSAPTPAPRRRCRKVAPGTTVCGDETIGPVERDLREHDVFVRDIRALKILRKILRARMEILR